MRLLYKNRTILFYIIILIAVYAYYEYGRVKEFEDIQKYYKIIYTQNFGHGKSIIYEGIEMETNTSRAVKMILKNSRLPSDMEREIKVSQKFYHPVICNVEGVYEDIGNLYIVMEKFVQDLRSKIVNSKNRRLTEKYAKYIAAQVLAGLKYLHGEKMVYGDLKPSNIFFTEEKRYPRIKLCDFEHCFPIGAINDEDTMMELPFRAPETKINSTVDSSQDMWSLGVTLYQTLSGVGEEGGNSNAELFNILTQQTKDKKLLYPDEIWSNITETAKDFIDRLLMRDPRLRLTVHQALGHPWLQDYETWRALKILENRAGQRYVTKKSDDLRWAHMTSKHFKANDDW